MMSFVLACDLGGSGLRVGLVDAAGRIVHSAGVALSLPFDAGGGSEVDPAVWWRALCRAVDALAAGCGGAWERVEAVAVAGITRTQVFLGADGRPVRAAVSFRDTRAAGCLAEVKAALSADDPEFGQVNAFHPLARLGWLMRAEPDVARSVAAVVEPKDFLALRLTGVCAIDPIGSARLIASRRMLAALGFSPGIVPSVVQPATVLGWVQAGLAGALGRLAGRPVVAMGNDTWASAVGLGALRDGYAYNLSGTTEVLGVLSARAVSAEGLMTVEWGGGLHQVGGPSQAGGDTIGWLMGLLGRDGVIGPALAALLAEPRQGQPLLFLPYLQGERVPYWDPALRGAFIGLNRGHGPVDCAYAVLEGIGFLNRLVLERAETTTGVPVREIRFGGGGAANAVWCQIKADICERPVVVTDCAEPGLLAGAICASTALGRFPDMAAGQSAWGRPRAVFEPEPQRVATYRRLYELFRAAEAAVAPVSRALAALG